MERARDLIGPVLAVALITGAALTSRWMSYNRSRARVGTKEGPRGVPVEPEYQPTAYRFLYLHEPGAVAGRLTFVRIVDGRIGRDATWSFAGLDEWCDWAPGFFAQEEGWTPRYQPGWQISRWLSMESTGRTRGCLFWRIQALRFLDPESIANEINWIEASGKTLTIHATQGWPHYDYDSDTLHWNPVASEYGPEDPNLVRQWYKTTPLITLAYVLSHACHDLCHDGDLDEQPVRERFALATENRIRHILFLADPACSHIRPRPGFRETWPDTPGRSAQEAWWDYRGAVEY